MKKAKVGRPKGSKNEPKLTKKGLSPSENLNLAVAGDLNGKLATAYAAQLWSGTHPRKKLLDLNVAEHGSTPERELEISIEGAESWFIETIAPEMFSRVKAGDGQFFKDFGETIERLSLGGWPADPKMATLLAFVTIANRLVSVQESTTHLQLNGFPNTTEDEVRRICRELGLPRDSKPGPKPGAVSFVKRLTAGCRLTVVERDGKDWLGFVPK